jgi:Spy/CpxP family protein refolding chaperone
MSHNLAVRPAAPTFWISPKLAGVGVLLLVFLSGAVAGAVAMNLGAHAALHPRPFWDNSSKTEYLKTVARQLDLTPAQSAQMESILDDFAKYYQTVLSDGRARIFNILTDEQKVKFEKMLKERPRN